ncbi:unnamed protein product [Rhizoctonia solani]|uniref:Uncharacterized protein n=1 Tax=Rhizoctonia solani TaxID=456999 RepID=A0A8H3I1J9_9AGAM|nr:unnamed protein product [Rhizoctonia solani]
MGSLAMARAGTLQHHPNQAAYQPSTSEFASGSTQTTHPPTPSRPPTSKMTKRTRKVGVTGKYGTASWALWCFPA